MKNAHYKIISIKLEMPISAFEAESVAYTVCQYFGIDTSDYSFGYIAGWSSGKDMKELQSSLDTIRKTVSEFITGIEGALRELQLNREMMQEKDTILLVRNSDLSEYDLLNVRGMEKEELLTALHAMDDDDRLSVEAYLEGKGAWVTLLGDEKTEEVEEYHLDYIYNTDTQKIGNFTLRKPETLKVSFTSEQQERFDRKDGDLYNELYFDDSLY